jgi:hypothetical protein
MMREPVWAWKARDGSLHSTEQECIAHEILKILVHHRLIQEFTSVPAFIKAAEEIGELYKDAPA